MTPSLLADARRAAASGEDELAKATFLECLRESPDHLDVLIELGNLALATGHRSAARSAYRRAVQCHPANAIAHVNLGNVYLQDRDPDAARIEFDAALAIDSDIAAAHQGLARVHEESGDSDLARRHRDRGFSGSPLIRRPARGRTPPVRVLVLAATRSGNTPTEPFLDDHRYDVTALHVDYWDCSLPLPAHDVVFNAIGDADLCTAELACARRILAGNSAPVINPPARVELTGRIANSRRLASIHGVVAPLMRAVTRRGTGTDAMLSYPLLLRVPGFHMGRHFIRVESAQEFADSLATLPGDDAIAIEYLDSRGNDGRHRKYRVMFIDRALYPLHLAVSTDWKVHYFSADMAHSQEWRDEEQRFLDDMPSVIGAPAMAALRRIAEVLQLDYAGVDFGIDAGGNVLLFEANATMTIAAPAADSTWDYRRPAIARATAAAAALVASRARSATARPDR